MALNPTSDQAQRKHAEFIRMLETCSAPSNEQGDLNRFPDDDEALIQRRVARMLYEPCLPIAGDLERSMIDRLEKLALEKDWAGSARAFVMAAKFKELLPNKPYDNKQILSAGCYECATAGIFYPHAHAFSEGRTCANA